MRREPATMNEFADAVRKDLQENLEGIFPGIKVSVQQVDKIQNGSYLGVRIDREDGIASPVLSLEKPYEDMKTVRPYERVISDIIRQAENVLRDMPQIGASDLENYDHWKNNLIMQVISVKGNEDRLADIPHRQMEDMAVVYRVMMDSPYRGGEMSFLVTNSIMQSYGITPDQLYADASHNMSQNLQYSIRPLFNVLADMNPVFADDPMDIKVKRAEKGHFQTTVTACLSPTFFGWVFQWGGKVCIAAPDEAVAAYKEMAKRILD